MAIITNVDTSIFPYNDNEMVYDLSLRQYKLTVSGVKDILGYNLEVDMGSIALANIFMNEISDIIYNHIYAYSQVKQIELKRYMIAKDKDLRELFKKVLLAQTRYAIRSGANLIGDMHGINFERGKALEEKQVRGDILISAQAQNILKRSGLLYTGYMYIPDIEDDGTW